MKKYPRSLLLCVLILLFLLLGGLYLWKMERESENRLAAISRQYDVIGSKIMRYQAQKQLLAASEKDAGSLFSEINKIAAQTGVQDRLENLRPAEDRQGETLELQLRALYLGETMRFISFVESLKNTVIERLNLRRNPNTLLDLELRIKRQHPTGNNPDGS